MSYLVQSKMAQDYQFILRIAACAASEGVNRSPSSWADDNRQKLVATPGWAEAYADSFARHTAWVKGDGPCPPPPGEDEGAVTDVMIRDAVRAVLADEAAAAAEESEES